MDRRIVAVCDDDAALAIDRRKRLEDLLVRAWRRQLLEQPERDEGSVSTKG